MNEPSAFVVVSGNHSTLIAFAAVPRRPVDEKRPRFVLVIISARVLGSTFTGLTPSTVVSIKQASRFSLLFTANFLPSRSLFNNPGVIAPRVIAPPRVSASSCASLTLKRTTAPLSPLLAFSPKSSSAQDTAENAMLPTNKAESA